MPKNSSSIHHCKRCGEAIATASPTGLCPGCMFGGALGLERSEDFESEGSLDSADLNHRDPTLGSGEAPDPLEGTRIGRYKILQRIGEGGFGLVYMAEQIESVHRKVALKVIKAGMDTKQVIARFEAERQALALMDHPNIARFLDVGETAEGRPYFVMELVKGMPITQYCREKKLPAEARIALFIQVCRAIQHAHVKGIIHRDLKPSNILITLQDGQAIPKVIDFGIAKAMDQRLTDKTLFTRFEHMLGTPAYMSPEQVALSAVDVDTRGGGATVLSIDIHDAEEHTCLEPADHLSPEAVFERHWASSILNAVMQRLRESYEIEGKTEVFEALKDSLGLGRGERSYREIGDGLGISETAARLTVHRMRKRYRQFLLQQIASTLDPEGSAEDELRYLFGVFQS